MSHINAQNESHSNPDETTLPGRDPDFTAKLAHAQSQLTATLGVPLPNPATNTTSKTTSHPVVKHGSKLAVGALLASSLLLGACGNSGPDRCTTQYVTPTAAPGNLAPLNQTPVAVQYCQDNNGNPYYTGGYYGGSHYYGGGYYGGGSSYSGSHSSGSSGGGFSSSGGSSSS